MSVAILASLFAMQARACTSRTGPAATAASFSDPRAYCAAVRTIDKPDARYTGNAVPDAVINGFERAAGLESTTEPMEMLRKTTIWRCMNGKVYACNFGANLPCDSKANTSRSPTQPMTDYCKANPGSDFIPMSVTGHDTVYSWHCATDMPEILEQTSQVDAAGYLAQIWYAVTPAP
ncbi:MAG TPA: hypothetical protein VMJ64_17250 [Anaerolineales bacterium]|nr:hypothetical protein [Anaerolineales bacterium]